MNQKERVETILQHYYHRQGKTVRKQTIIVYTNKLTRLYKLYGESDITKNIFKNPEKFIKFLELEFQKQNSRALYLSSSLVWMQAITVNDKLVKKYRKYLYDLSDKRKITQKSKMFNKLKIEKIDIDILRADFEIKILDINFKNIKFEDRVLLQDYLIFLFYSGIYTPPPRNDIFKILVLDVVDDKLTSNNFNYISLEKKMIIYKDYKAVKAHGVLHVDIPEEFFNIILKYKDIISTDNFLFKNLKTGKLYSKNTFGKKIKSVYNGKATINDLRHLYLTTKYAKIKEFMLELYKDTRSMGSSNTTALSYYIHSTVKEIESKS